jgi:hypothetical protein
MLATEPVYSFTMLSKYLSIDATTKPPSDANNSATKKRPLTWSLMPEKIKFVKVFVQIRHKKIFLPNTSSVKSAKV